MICRSRNCHLAGQDQPITNFHKNRTNNSGRVPQCAECIKKYRAQYLLNVEPSDHTQEQGGYTPLPQALPATTLLALATEKEKVAFFKRDRKLIAKHKGGDSSECAKQYERDCYNTLATLQNIVQQQQQVSLKGAIFS